MPLISVVMPAYNSGRFLAEAVESILQQTIPDFELIIVDDGSTDETLEVASRLAADRRVKPMPGTARAGLAVALNRGFAVAEGEFLARMDSDDIAHPRRFARQLERLRAEPALALVGSAVRDIDAAGKAGRRRSFPEHRDRVAFASLYRNPVMHPTMMMRRDSLPPSPYRVDLPSAEDYGLILPLARARRVANVPDVLLRYRVHQGSVTARARTSMLESTRRAMWEQFRAAPFAPPMSESSVDALFEALYHRRRLGRDALEHLVAGFRESARHHASAQAAGIVDDLCFALVKSALASRDPVGLVSVLAVAGRRAPSMLGRSLAEAMHRFR